MCSVNDVYGTFFPLSMSTYCLAYMSTVMATHFPHAASDCKFLDLDHDDDVPRLKTWVPGFHDISEVKKLVYNSLGNTGLVVSQLGFGGSAIGGVHSVTDDQTSIDVVRLAIKKGINYIDTAPWYGQGRAEEVLGQALAGVPRDAYYVATKVGRYSHNPKEMFDFSAERTLQSVDESLKRLQLDYVDIIQVHDIEFAPNLEVILNETLPALQKVKDNGKAKFIGITGYPLTSLKNIIEQSHVKIDTVLSYCRCCIFDNTLTEYIGFFKKHNLAIINAAIVGMGLLTNRGPASWHPASAELKDTCAKATAYCQVRDVNVSKLAVHFSLCQPGPHTHLISVADSELLQQNLDTAVNGLTSLEERTLSEIIQKFFSPLAKSDWEGIEVQNYWNEMKNSQKL